MLCIHVKKNIDLNVRFFIKYVQKRFLGIWYCYSKINRFHPRSDLLFLSLQITHKTYFLLTQRTKMLIAVSPGYGCLSVGD